MKTIYLAGGCFWGVDEYFRILKGVIDTDVGYANSDIVSPTYEQVCSGKTNAVETCKVIFDESEISFKNLLEHFFKIINPNIINRQGNDIGTQYRSGIYFQSPIDEKEIMDFISEVQKNYKETIVTEVKVLQSFFLAEDYHQDYLVKNPNGYCHCSHEINELKKQQKIKKNFEKKF
ncbi:MAG: peptide-methionine (S)-S-oxide reductase MsrA [Fusobacteriaceae bacterium]